MLFVLLFPFYLNLSFSDENQREIIEIQRISENVYQHTSYLHIPNYGTFPCNGLVYLSEGEAAIIDTPIDSMGAMLLYNFITIDKKAKPVAVIVNHYHDDCLNTLNYYHAKGIPSYASEKCIELAKRDSLSVPENGFKKELVLTIGKQELINYFPGEAHSPDNIVTYIPSEKVLFGGCMIKEMNAKKGNLADANLKTWSKTVQKVQNKFKKAETIVPGHGKTGGRELFNYTIQLFHPN